MPVMPDCHGSEYSRLGSQPGGCCPSIRFLMFGIDCLSSFSSQPSLIMRPGKPDESVITMPSVLIPSAGESGPWDVPKYDWFSLMSSTCLTFTPYFLVKPSSVGCFFAFPL